MKGKMKKKKKRSINIAVKSQNKNTKKKEKTETRYINKTQTDSDFIPFGSEATETVNDEVPNANVNVQKPQRIKIIKRTENLEKTTENILQNISEMTQQKCSR